MSDQILDTEIVEIDEKAFEAAFSGAPGPDDIVGGTDKTEEKKEKKPETEKKEAPPEDTSIEEIDLDEVEEEKKEDEKESDKDKKPAEKAEKKESESEDGSDLVKAHVDFLIEQGIWQDIEDRENIKWSDELFAQAAQQQAVAAAESMFEEMVDQSGQFGKAIFQHIANGGDPEKIIDIFKEQKSFESLDISSTDGQKLAVDQYYKDVLKWKPERVKRHIERLELDEELEAEAKFVKEEHEKVSADKLAKIQAAQAAHAKKREEDEKNFRTNMLSAIDEMEEMDTAAKKQLLSRVLDYNKELPDGRKVTQFYIDFVNVQQDPVKYLKLAEFVANMEKFEVTKAQKKVESEKKSTIKFLKAGTANTKAKSQAKAERQTSSPGLNW